MPPRKDTKGKSPAVPTPARAGAADQGSSSAPIKTPSPPRGSPRAFHVQADPDDLAITELLTTLLINNSKNRDTAIIESFISAI